MTARLNLARPSPDRIIEANRPRDWFDAHCDYAVTGDVVYRAERLSHEDRYQEMPSQTEGTGALQFGADAVRRPRAVRSGEFARLSHFVRSRGCAPKHRSLD